MIKISPNGNITMNRGDTFSMPLVINYGTSFAPKYYELTEYDTIYFCVAEQSETFEEAVIKKVFDKTDFKEGNLTIKLSRQDTENMLAGDYYYEIKLRHAYFDERENEIEFVDTIVPRKKFTILE